jgi:hypothetical protein
VGGGLCDIMRLPKKIKVSGYMVSIRYGEKVFVNGDECFGHYDSNTKTITLAKGMSKVRKREVFLHEYLHFIEDIYRIKISEENIAAFSLGLLTLLTDKRIRWIDG